MSPNEIKVLTYLVTSGKPYCTHEEIIKHVWGNSSPKDVYNNLKVMICYARGHLDHYGIRIINVRGVGYGIDPKDQPRARVILADIIKRKTGVDVPWRDAA